MSTILISIPLSKVSLAGKLHLSLQHLINKAIGSARRLYVVLELVHLGSHPLPSIGVALQACYDYIFSCNHDLDVIVVPCNGSWPHRVDRLSGLADVEQIVNITVGELQSVNAQRSENGLPPCTALPITIPEELHHETDGTEPGVKKSSQSSHTSTSNGFLPLNCKPAPTVCLGGSFDHLHAGHKLLLTQAAAIATENIVIGLADGPLLERKRYKEMMESYDTREKAVLTFLEDVAPHLHVEVTQLLDPFGPAVTRSDIQCLVVSQETHGGGEAVNAKRVEHGFAPLDIVSVGLVGTSEIDGMKLSSTAIRQQLYERRDQALRLS